MFLNLPHEQTHILTAGMMSGPKFRLLADLIARSDHPNKGKMLGILNKIRGETKREVLAHAYLLSTKTKVTFLHRKGGDKYSAKEYSFGLQEFYDHVKILTQAAEDFDVSLGAPGQEVSDFVAAALRANKSTSPGAPSDDE